VSHYEAGRFDVIIDNLTIAHWVGATSVKSLAYFRQLHRILGPAGVLVYHGNWGGARRAILAGLTETFRDVQVHPGRDAVEEVVLASDRPLDIDPVHVARLLDERPISGLASPDGLVGGLTRVAREDVGRSRPVRDDLLVYEYYRDPLRAARHWARSLARRVGAALVRSAAGGAPY
jgi:SAM-dependent methyltransferase